jgi:hypothetical protein
VLVKCLRNSAARCWAAGFSRAQTGYLLPRSWSSDLPRKARVPGLEPHTMRRRVGHLILQFLLLSAALAKLGADASSGAGFSRAQTGYLPLSAPTSSSAHSASLTTHAHAMHTLLYTLLYTQVCTLLCTRLCTPLMRVTLCGCVSATNRTPPTY